VNVIDAANGKVLKDQTVRIRKGLIEDVSKSRSEDMQEAGYSTIDARGLFMCPGLIDCE
jgi:imidazolonepropionase-like amidohydrolase